MAHTGEKLEHCLLRGYLIHHQNHHRQGIDINFFVMIYLIILIIVNIYYNHHSFGVRAAKVDGVLHLTGGWSDAGDSSLVSPMIPKDMMLIMIQFCKRHDDVL